MNARELLKSLFATIGIAAAVFGAMVVGFGMGEKAEAARTKLQLIRGVDCELPERLETLVLAVSRDDGDKALLYSCTVVGRKQKSGVKRVDPS